MHFTKKLYSVLGTKKASDLAHDFRSEYDALNVDGKLGGTLEALYEMRLEDLMMSVKHAKKMKKVLTLLGGV